MKDKQTERYRQRIEELTERNTNRQEVKTTVKSRNNNVINIFGNWI